jgi:hypothetical protein
VSARRSAQMSTSHSRAKLSQHALWQIGHVTWQAPHSSPARKLILRNFSVERARRAVDDNDVAILQQRQSPTVVRFRCHVTDHDAAAGAGEATVGDKGDVAARRVTRKRFVAMKKTLERDAGGSVDGAGAAHGPSCAPTSAAPGESISGMPGEPFGPS